MRFVDTNVLLYAVSRVQEDDHKRRTALLLLREDDLVLSAQVLQEFYVQATPPSRPDVLASGDAVEFIESLLHFRIESITLEVFRSALEYSQRFQLSYWDSAILAAARISGCDTVLSEDLSPDQDYGGLRVVNPFTH